MSLQIFSKTDLIFFALAGYLLTIAAFLYIEHRQKSICPGYPIVCPQHQGLIWFALRLENDQKFYEDFKESASAGKILHIWIMQLFSIICTLLVHFFLKWLQKVILNRQLDENSTLVIMFKYITDREILFEDITKMIKIIVLTETRTKNRLELIRYLLLQTLRLISYLAVIFLTVCVFGFVGFITYDTSYRSFNGTLSTGASRYLLLPFTSVYAIFLIATAVIVAWLTVAYIAKLFKQAKYIFIFLSVFMAYYCVISIALYFLESILPFDGVHAIYILMGFVFFSYACLKKIIFYCDKPKKK